MYLNHFFLEYENIVKDFPEQCRQDYQSIISRVENSSAKFQGETIPFLYQPMFFTHGDILAFAKLTNIVMGILDKVVEKYLASAEFRKKFGFSPLLEELILVDPGYPTPVPMARLDIFYYQPHNFKFCEFNADGSSGMNKSNVLEKIFLDSLPMRRLKLKYKIHYFELIEKWVNHCLQLYDQFAPQQTKPNVAIVDWQGAGNIKEFEAFQEAFMQKGCRTVIADPRQLKYDGRMLSYQDMKIDLVYRRVVTSELIQRQAEVRDLISAYRDKAVCMVGPLRSEISHNKIIFKVLHQDTEDILTAEEREFVQQHIPFTAEFQGDRSIFSQVLKNKDRYVLKPTDMYAAAGVYLGKEFSETRWRQIIEQCWENNYLYQEYCQPFCGRLVDIEQRVSTSLYNQMVGLFVYDKKFSGLYTRVGQGDVISQQQGYFILPNYYLAE